MAVSLPVDFNNNRQGNGKYKPLRTIEQKQEKFIQVDEDLRKVFDEMDRANIRTTFKQASDPVYLAFKHIDNKPLPTLAKEFVQDSTNDFIEFISKIFA